MANLSSYVPPDPIPPTAPDFAFCSAGYGHGMTRSAALWAGGILPYGTTPRVYTVNDPSTPSGLFDIPYYTSFSGVAISVEVAGPVDIDQIELIPNEIRGMAGWLANRCTGSRGVGGFVTRGIQGIVDYVTDPTTNLDAPEYPDNTAFVTVTLSSPPQAASFPGDYDPEMAYFLRQAEIDAFSRTEPSFHAEIAGRILKYALQGQQMRRLGHIAWWADPEDEPGLNGNGTETITLQLSNSTTMNTADAQRERRIQRYLRDRSTENP